MTGPRRRSVFSRVLDQLFAVRQTHGFARLNRLETLEARDVPAVVPFAQPQTLAATPAAPSWSLLADFDGDGDQDVVVASAGSNTLAWLPNDGAGHFGAARPIAAAGKANVIDAGDIDGNGTVDVLAFNTDPAALVWYSNDGHGNFSTARAVAASPGGAVRGQLADVNGDGKLDAVLNNNAAGTVTYFANSGTGMFGAGVTVATGLPYAFHLGFADFTGDGKPDMVAPSTTQNAAFLFANDGTGHFGAGQAVSVATSAAYDALPADFNGDGKLDVGVAYYALNKVVYYPGDGLGHFGAGVDVASVSGAFGVQTADFNGDGKLDALINGVGNGELVWAVGDGHGNFSQKAVAMALPGVYVSSSAVADLDGDGDADILANGSGAGVYLGENRRGQSATVVVPPAAGTYLTNQQVDVGVYYGYPVTVAGTPSITMTVGSQTVQAKYVAGSGTNQLTFRYVVTSGAVDADGVTLGTQIALNGGSLTGPDFAPLADLSVPAVDLSGVKVDGTAPLVSSITRADATPTAERVVRFAVTFDRPVTGVDAADFVLTADGVTGAAVTKVEGAGTTYVVTASTGAGSGTLRLEVKAGASVANAAGVPLAAGFSGGQAYSLQRRPARTISQFYQTGHGDLAADFVGGKWQFGVNTDAQGSFAADGVEVVAGHTALTTVPAGPEWAFEGAAAGAPVYKLPNVPSADLPFLGLGAEHTARGTFASYYEADPRVAGTSPWIKFTLVGVKAPAGGQFAMYTQTDTGPKVWMSTADGITAADAFWAREGSHDHFNTTFTKAGHYELSFVASGYLDANGNKTYDPGIDPYNESGIVTYYFDIDPAGGPQPYTIAANPLPPAPPPTLVPFGVPTAVDVQLPGAIGVAAGDFDHDGDLDLAAVGYDTGTILWYENLGGAFTTPRVIDTGVTSAWELTAGDVNGDGYADLFTGTYDTKFLFYKNNGDGTFAPAVTLSTTLFGPKSLVVDLDNDGKMDVVAAALGTNPAVWFRGHGDGTFDAPVSIASSTRLGGVAVGDIDGDGDLDLAYGDYRTSVLSWKMNIGDGTFAAPQSLTASGGATVDALVDLTGDGRPDILSEEFNTSHIVVYPNLGNGTFGPGQVVAGTPGDVSVVKAADFDNDGDLDLLVGTYPYEAAPRLVWLPNLGGGTFGAPLSIASSPGMVGRVALADFDGDGDTDVAWSSNALGQVLVAENRTGQFSNRVVAPPAGTYVAGYAVDVAVHFGYPVAVTGTPEIDLTVGGHTVTARYVFGAGTPALTFRYVVTAADRDLDGIGVGPAVRLAGGTILDPLGRPAPLGLPAADLSGVKVNGAAPVVSSIRRLDANPTAVGQVAFEVTFSKPVVGVAANTFTVAADGVAGAALVSVGGAGAVYRVVVGTGTGSGTVGLGVSAGAGVADAAGNALGAGFTGGEVYSLARRPARTISTYYETAHGDLDVGYFDGVWGLTVHNNAGDYPADGVLMTSGPAALKPTPTGPAYAFLGATGPQTYIWPADGSNADVPYLGLAAKEGMAGTFAAYLNTDPRVNATGAWIKLQMVGFRAPAGGNLSFYQPTDDGPRAFWTTSDGVTPADAIWLREVGHEHYSWAFTKAGHYEIDVVASGYLDTNGNGTYDPGIDSYTESGVTTYYFDIDPPGGPQPYTIPADPLPTPPSDPAPVTPAPRPVPAPVAAAAGGAVRVVGADGNTSTVNPFPGFAGEVRTARADLNGDGVLDIVAAAGAGATPHVKVIDGKTGAELMSFLAYDARFAGGVFVAAGDVTGDGVADIITGSGAGAAHVKVFDGKTGAEVRSFLAYDGFQGGVTVAAGDLNGDRVAEILTGTATGATHVKAFDGKTGSALLSFLAYEGFKGGVYLAAGDLDGDGRAEIVTGTGPGAGPHVKVFRGDGTAVGGFLAYGAGFAGGVRVGTADTDGDGQAEIVVGAGPGAKPHVKVFNGRNFDVLSEFLAGDPAFAGGVFVS